MKELKELENSAVTYHRLIVDGLRYFNKDISEIERMDMKEYSLYMEASALQRQDARLQMHEQAFIHQQAKATKKSGQSLYKKFNEFYGKDHEKNIRKIERNFFPEKFATEDNARKERAQKFTVEDFKFLGNK